ncbi:YuzD family protein [Lihuaxuella thermophila]|uniref:Disulfide oxidoreductase YuzD n=1 Tax=Lihuaxuella thermophila TaxID=1173111 RepID=A0A1H8HM11_9BACL|nr:YuzD family protein [Lihuaxuella thermophila]SEN57153.1 Disulfide oxidoreductase YuzD [Lihuaxuella thermophila]
MEDLQVEICVYGAEQICPSCVNLPSSRETAEWLQAALDRKYGSRIIRVRYIDIHQPEGEKEKSFSKRVIEEDLWYPVVVIQDQIVAEGNPKLKDIYAALEKIGIAG